MTRLNLMAVLQPGPCVLSLASRSCLLWPCWVHRSRLWQAERSHSELEAFSRRLETVLNADVASQFEAVAISSCSLRSFSVINASARTSCVTWRVKPAAPLQTAVERCGCGCVVRLSRRASLPVAGNRTDCDSVRQRTHGGSGVGCP